VKEGDEKQEPVADFHPHKRHFFVFRMSKHAWIELKPQPEVTQAIERLIGKLNAKYVSSYAQLSSCAVQ
jgi:hypothetical protein